MLARARAISIANNTVNRVNFYSIPSWVIDQLMTIVLNTKYGDMIVAE